MVLHLYDTLVSAIIDIKCENRDLSKFIGLGP